MPTDRSRLRQLPHYKTIRDMCITAVVALIVVIPLQHWFVKPYIVRQVSMEPTLRQFNYLLVNRWSYRRTDPVRGDIIVFRPSQTMADATNLPPNTLIKRIIGLPGEHIEIKDRRVWIDGLLLDETTYLPSGTETWGDVNITLGAGQYFVMGDNRNHSQDSRWFGPITRSMIIGPAWIRLLPIGQAGYFQDTVYPL